MSDEKKRLVGGAPWMLNNARLREDLYKLLTVVIAASPGGAWEWIEHTEFAGLQEECEQEAIDHSLVTIAIRSRILMGEKLPRPKAARAHCGTLSDERGQRPLTLREACNKIIHAEHRRLTEWTDKDPEGDPGLTGNVDLEGSVEVTDLGTGRRITKRWLAKLEIFAFVKAVLALANGPMRDA